MSRRMTLSSISANCPQSQVIEQHETRLTPKRCDAYGPFSLDMTQPLRPRHYEQDRREEYQAIAPAIRDGFYVVPKVIE